MENDLISLYRALLKRKEIIISIDVFKCFYVISTADLFYTDRYVIYPSNFTEEEYKGFGAWYADTFGNNNKGRHYLDDDEEYDWYYWAYVYQEQDELTNKAERKTYRRLNTSKKQIRQKRKIIKNNMIL